MDKLIEWGDGFYQYRDDPETVFVKIEMGDACLYNTQASLLMDEIQTAFKALWPSKYFESIDAHYGCFVLEYDAKVRDRYKPKTLTNYVQDVQDMIYSSDVVLQLYWLNESFWERDVMPNKVQFLLFVIMFVIRAFIKFSRAPMRLCASLFRDKR